MIFFNKMFAAIIKLFSVETYDHFTRWRAVYGHISGKGRIPFPRQVTEEHNVSSFGILQKRHFLKRDFTMSFCLLVFVIMILLTVFFFITARLYLFPHVVSNVACHVFLDTMCSCCMLSLCVSGDDLNWHYVRKNSGAASFGNPNVHTALRSTSRSPFLDRPIWPSLGALCPSLCGFDPPPSPLTWGCPGLYCPAGPGCRGGPLGGMSSGIPEAPYISTRRLLLIGR